jgi:hypothetical protein
VIPRLRRARAFGETRGDRRASRHPEVPVRRLVLVSILAAWLAAPACAPRPEAGAFRGLRELTTPCPTGAADPSLAVGPDGRLALTWSTRTGEGHDAWVAVSADSGVTWGAPVRVNERDGRVSSYPESRPVAAWGEGGLLFVAYAAKRDSGLYADDVAVRTSRDGGATWDAAVLVNSDRDRPRSCYHGFAALTVLPDGTPFVAWIDGRSHEGEGDEPGRAEVWCASSADSGRSWGADRRVAGEVCPCCHIRLDARTIGGVTRVAIAYRGAREDLRDPRLAVSDDGGATFARDTLVAWDRWRLPGCPSVGPAVVLDDSGATVAWFTGESPDDDSLPGRPAPGLYLATWNGASGATGERRSLGEGLGEASRPLLARLPSGTLAAAIGRAPAPSARTALGLRVVGADGALSPWTTLGGGVTSADVVTLGTAVWAAWTERHGDETRVRMARLDAR